MSNFWDLHQDQFEYEDGTKIAFSVLIDRQRLARLVYKAAKNKSGKKLDGALKIEAKRLSGPTQEAH